MIRWSPQSPSLKNRAQGDWLELSVEFIGLEVWAKWWARSLLFSASSMTCFGEAKDWITDDPLRWSWVQSTASTNVAKLQIWCQDVRDCRSTSRCEMSRIWWYESRHIQSARRLTLISWLIEAMTCSRVNFKESNLEVRSSVAQSK